MRCSFLPARKTQGLYTCWKERYFHFSCRKQTEAESMFKLLYRLQLSKLLPPGIKVLKFGNKKLFYFYLYHPLLELNSRYQILVLFNGTQPSTSQFTLT